MTASASGSAAFARTSTEGLQRLQVLHVTNWLSRKGGGIPPVIWALSRATQALGHSTAVAGIDDSFVESDCKREGVAFFAGRIDGPQALGFSRELGAHLRSQEGTSIVHSHGLWMHPGSPARQTAERNRVPLVISPHGMLEPWTLQYSKWKKRAFAWVLENKNLRSANCLHALCESEAKSFRAYGLSNPIALIPNGIDAEAWQNLPSRDAILSDMPQLKGKRRLLFLSRIHPKKGLANLLKAWAALGSATNGWILLIAGPDEVGHLAELQQLSHELRLNESVRFPGPQYGEAKKRLLASADAFVLPSFSEGFSMAILEAAASGVPVLLTDECHFPELADADGGIEIDTHQDRVAGGLREMLSLPDEARLRMGERGRALVQQRYTWNVVARSMLEVYRWLRDEGPCPPCVQVR